MHNLEEMNRVLKMFNLPRLNQEDIEIMNNLDNILKSRDITLPTKVRLVKAMVIQWSCMDVRVRL